MKKITMIFVFILTLLVICSCAQRKSASSAITNDKLTYVDREGWGDQYGYAYVQLPISKELIYEKKSLLEGWGVTDRILAEAEAELLDMFPEGYDVLENGMGAMFYSSDGILYLRAEIIVDIDPPSFPVLTGEDAETYYNGDYSGCGIDHEHMFFEVLISSKYDPTVTTSVKYTADIETTDGEKIPEATTSD
jgi:hypothetical protein